MSASHGRRSRVLVVDDEPKNRELVREALEPRGYDVLEAASGAAALAAVETAPPDVVLLDVSMPGMDGLEVCRRLKAHPATAAIPVIMVTAHAHRRDRIAGIDSGANDYVAKPVDLADLVLRVRNAVRLKELHDRVAEDYGRLQELERLRDGLIHMLIHDLRAPLTSIMLALELIEMEAPERDLSAAAAIARRSAQSMAEMISSLLDISRLEAGVMPLHCGPVPLADAAAQAVEPLQVLARQQGVTVDLRAPAAPIIVHADADILRRVVTNLVSNAVKFTPSGGSVCVTVAREGEQGRLDVADTGPGVPPEHCERIFEKFGQVHERHARRGSGLGLTFCKLAVEAHRGTIGVESEVGKGSRFWVRLPLAGGGTP